MKFLKLPILFFLLLISCSKEKNEHIKLSGNIEILNSDSIILKTDNLKKLYFQKDTLINIEVNKDGKFTNTLKIPEGYYLLNNDDLKIPLYLKNRFDLKLELDNEKITFNGKGENENNYLTEKRKLEDSISPYNGFGYYSQLNESRFLKHLNSLEKSRLDLLKNFDVGKDFEFLEVNSASIDKAHVLMNYPFARKKIIRDYVQSNNYPDPLKELDINNERLLNIPHYNLFLFLYVITSAVDENENYSVGNSYINYIDSESFAVTNKNIKEEVLYLTAVNTLSTSYDLKGFYDKYMNISQNKTYQKEITEKYLDLIKLNQGQPIPELELTDINGKNIKFDNFKDYILYIDIWASWCKPCIEEIPNLIQLQERFKNENVKFITIARKSEKDKIAKLIAIHNLKTINIYDPENEKRIEDMFQITSIPRYLLINKNGIIYDISAKKPSDAKLITQINSLL
jgi:thiol-disulfide isomerase/thioredoxin